MDPTRKRPLLVRLAPALLLLLVAAPARGALLRYDFGGVIPGLVAKDGSGDPVRFSGSLIYDDAISFEPGGMPSPGTASGLYYSGTYRPGNSRPDGTGLEVRIDGLGLAMTSPGVIGQYQSWTRPNGEVYDQMFFSAYDASKSWAQRREISLFFQAHATPAFTDGSLPAGLKLSDLSRAVAAIEIPHDGDPNRRDSYSGELDTLTVTPVPEPAWTVAAFLGAAFWAARRRHLG